MEFGRITSSGNLLDANPGFENTSLWSEVRDGDYPGTAFFRSTWGMAAPHGGSYAYTISNQAYGSLNSDMINVSASTTYDAYAWVRGETDPDESYGNWMLQVRHYDSCVGCVRRTHQFLI